MSRYCAFTICAKNYFGLAEALGRSLKAHHPEIDFVIFLADEPKASMLNKTQHRFVSARTSCGISAADWVSMSFKYDLVEFCTAIKPFCMASLFEEGYDIVFYFDPDVAVFGPLNTIFGALETHKVIVTPHRLDIDNDIPSRGGIYNLGFIAARAGRSTERMIRWWQDRLNNHCTVDPMRGFFTDQKWMDHLPVVYDNDEVFVSRSPGLNFAPWNFDERALDAREGSYIVRLKSDDAEAPLVFAHFSAMNYKDLARGELDTTASIRNREAPLRDLTKAYGSAIGTAGFLDYVHLPYSYGVYSNGVPIEYSHRRIYKRLCEEGYQFDNPFDASGEFYMLIDDARMILPEVRGADRLKPQEVTNMTAKIELIDVLTSLALRIIGYHRFTVLARLMIRYLHLSNRARLLGPKFRKLTIEPF